MSGRGKTRVSITTDTDPWVWDGGRWEARGGDRTHSLSLSYCECTGSLACTNWCCSSSIAASLVGGEEESPDDRARCQVVDEVRTTYPPPSPNHRLIKN